MAVKPQLLIPAKQTVTVTESFQGCRRHDYYVQESTFLVCICEPFTVSLPSSNPLLLIKPVSPLLSPYGLLLSTLPPSHSITFSIPTPGTQWPQLNGIEAKAQVFKEM